jgi:hypothetical protein
VRGLRAVDLSQQPHHPLVHFHVDAVGGRAGPTGHTAHSAFARGVREKVRFQFRGLDRDRPEPGGGRMGLVTADQERGMKWRVIVELPGGDGTVASTRSAPAVAPRSSTHPRRSGCVTQHLIRLRHLWHAGLRPRAAEGFGRCSERVDDEMVEWPSRRTD